MIKKTFLLSVLFLAGLTACDQKVRFQELPTESISRAPQCEALPVQLLGSTTIEIGVESDLKYTNASRVFWYVILPDGERIFEGPELKISIDQVGTYPAAVWGFDSCNIRKQVNFDIVVVPSLRNPFISINNNAQYTQKALVDVQLSAEGAQEMYLTDVVGCSSGGVWEPYRTSAQWELKKEGLQESVYVKFRSAAKETACVSDAITFDKTAPSIQLTAVPPARSLQKKARFEFTSEDAVSGVSAVECSLNGASFQVCPSPVEFDNLNYGQHNFKVRATDFAGNISSSVQYDWEYVNLPPTVKITSAPPVSTTAKEAQFAFEGADESGEAVRFECQLDGSARRDCLSPLQYTDLALGEHVFKVYAIDSSQLESEPAVHTWTIVRQPPPPAPPRVELTRTPEKVTYEKTAIFEFVATHSGVGIRSFYCSFNQESFRVCQSPDRFQVELGDHQFQVYAVDNSGLVSEKVAYSWRVEKKRTLYSDDFIVDTKANKLDVVVVIDNSPSMREEQAKMANRFRTFIDRLTGLDWQLAMITTDARTGKKEGQDGRFLPFVGLNNQYVINASTPGVEDVFSKTVRRKETGSSNEEGIHSFLKSIQRVENRFFFRPQSHVATIIVSDEDERSNGKKLKPENQPENLIAKFQEIFKNQNTYSNHSIVLQPGVVSTRKCPQVGDFAAGETYMRLSRLTGGVIGDLCEDDYGQILSGIGDHLQRQSYTVLLKCEPVEPPRVTLNPEPAQKVEVELDGRKLRVRPHPPLGTKVRVEYYCD